MTMFDESSVYALSTENKIYRLELDRVLQKSICSTFASSVESLIGGMFDSNHPDTFGEPV
jgi:hypothetical protein